MYDHYQQRARHDEKISGFSWGAINAFSTSHTKYDRPTRRQTEGPQCEFGLVDVVVDAADHRWQWRRSEPRRAARRRLPVRRQARVRRDERPPAVLLAGQIEDERRLTGRVDPAPFEGDRIVAAEPRDGDGNGRIGGNVAVEPGGWLTVQRDVERTADDPCRNCAQDVKIISTARKSDRVWLTRLTRTRKRSTCTGGYTHALLRPSQNN